MTDTTPAAVAAKAIFETKIIQLHVRVGAGDQVAVKTANDIEYGESLDDDWDHEDDPQYRDLVIELHVPVNVAGEPDLTVHVPLPAEAPISAEPVA